MSVVIRPIEKSDYDNWHALWTGYLAYYETTLPDDHKTLAFSRLLDPATKVNGLLAVLDDVPVGLVHYIYHEHMWRAEGICYLQDLYSDPVVRGKGIGRKLIEAVYKEADKAGVPKVYWLTQDFNTTARHLYDRIGRLSPFIKYDRP